ncbi:MAG: serine/threonine protein kinase [Deltaproteobacteria bacterium]|nr:serine/threonine protein kinase [Deltaproteobacteria bacterium]
MAQISLGKVVGVGGFERLVAIKAMHPHMMEEQDYVDMFLDEARLAARIRHPNVVATLDVDQDDQGPFLVMEFVEGPTLAQMVKHLRKERQTLPLEVTLRIVVDTLNGLHAAHELTGKDKQPLSLVHRDVSPSNVIVGFDGITRLTDFGVARARVRLHSTRNSAVKRKLAYLPPEQLTEDDVDRRADIYAAGVVLWEALTSRRLFTAKSEAKLLVMLMAGATRTPREVNPEVPEPISDVCMRALALRPARRFATAADFAEALEDAASRAGMRTAKARQVGDYAESLPLAVTSTTDPPPPPAGDGSDVDTLSGATPLTGPRTGGSRPGTGGSVSRATVAAATESANGSGRRWPLRLGAIACVLAGVVGAAVLFWPERDPKPQSPAAPAVTGEPTAKPPATPSEPADSAPDPAATASSAPAAPPSASSSPTAPVSASAPVPPGSVWRPPTVPNKPWPPPPKPTSTAYRPPDL